VKAITLIPLDRITINDNGCWVWNGTKHEDGYGLISIGGKREYAHRVMYQLFVGPVNNNRELDHLCRNPACCNPSHLEAVSSRENSLRGNHPLFVVHRERRCREGHDLTLPENVYTRADGRARCRICAVERQRERRRQKRCAA
jgi:hypothetical protein